MTTAIKHSNADWANVASPNSDYARLADLISKGTPWKQAISISGVGYASGWLFCQRRQYAEEGTLISVPDNETQAAKVIRDLRLGQDQSWGEIMARTGLTESSARKLFTLASNVQSEGLRNGKGGRFFQGNAEAYAPAPKVGWVRPTEAGTTLPAEIVAKLVEAGALDSGDADELKAMTLKELRSMAKGLSLPTAGTKAQLVARLAEAYAQA